MVCTIQQDLLDDFFKSVRTVVTLAAAVANLGAQGGILSKPDPAVPHAEKFGTNSEGLKFGQGFKVDETPSTLPAQRLLIATA